MCIERETSVGVGNERVSASEEREREWCTGGKEIPALRHK